MADRKLIPEDLLQKIRSTTPEPKDGDVALSAPTMGVADSRYFYSLEPPVEGVAKTQYGFYYDDIPWKDGSRLILVRDGHTDEEWFIVL